MSEITLHTNIDKPIDEVWRAIADFGNIAIMNPGIISSELTSSGPIGVGASRNCDLGKGSSLNERVTAWDPGRSLTYEVTGGTKIPPFKTNITQVTLSSAGPNRTTFDFRSHFALKGGPIGALLERLVVKRKLRAIFVELVAGIKHHIETGEQIGPDSTLPIEAIS